MPSPRCDERMHQALGLLEEGVEGLELDVREQSISEWKRDYATAMISLAEPDLDRFEEFNLALAHEEIIKVLQRAFGRAFTIIRQRSGLTPPPYVEGQRVVQVWGYGSRYELEIEAYPCSASEAKAVKERIERLKAAKKKARRGGRS